MLLDVDQNATNLEELNEPQREAVGHTDGPLLVVAGAGSGKTRVLTHRIAHLLQTGKARPDQILAITFTNKSAAEMRERVTHMVGPAARAMWVMTFHAACGRILRREAERLGFKSTFSIYDQGDQVRLAKHCIEELDLDIKRFVPSSVHHRISQAKNQLITPEMYRSQISNFLEETIADIYARYDEALFKSNAMDFDDMLLKSVHLLENFPDVRQHWARNFKYLLVDEYQDTNHAQYKLLRLLGDEHRNICCVGDADQSVYSWRGADIRNITDFESDFPDAKVVVLDINYRSTRHILDAANGVVSHNEQRIEKDLKSVRGDGNKVEVVEVEDEHAEARFISARIEHSLANGYAPRDIAVFYRTNAQSRVVEDILTRQGVQYQVIGGPKFYERAEVKDLISYLSLIANPADSMALLRVYNTPRRGIGPTTMSKLQTYASTFGETLWTALEQAPLAGGLNAGTLQKIESFVTLVQGLRNEAATAQGVAWLVEAVLDRSGMIAAFQADGSIEAQGRIENLGELVNVAREYDTRTADPRLEDFLQSIALQSQQDDLDEESGKVTLMTLHNAKGLEFPVVFIGGLEEGLFPHSRSVQDGDVEEERRLCYVGITRAQDNLTLLHATSRTVFGRRSFNTASRFLDELPPDSIERVRRQVTSWSPGGAQGASFSGIGGTGGYRPGGYNSAQRSGGRGAQSQKPSDWGRNGAHTSGGFLGAELPDPAPDDDGIDALFGDEDAGSVIGGRASSSDSDAAFAVGDQVRHATFGDGVVLAIERGELAVVRFTSSGEQRRLMLAYAPLERL